MAFVPVNNVAKADIIYQINGEHVQNSIYVEKDTSWDNFSLQSLGQDIRDWWGGVFKFAHVTSSTIERIFVTDLTSETSPRVEYTANMPDAGVVAGLALPNNVAFAIRLLTDLRGRSYRGRVFHCGIPVAEANGNLITSAHKAALISSYEQLLSTINGTAGWTQVVVSRISGGVPRLGGVTTPITAISADDKLDSQRRRLAGRGN